jgi:hypothetical protein
MNFINKQLNADAQEPASTETVDQAAAATTTTPEAVPVIVTAHDDFDWSIDKRNVSHYSENDRVIQPGRGGSEYRTPPLEPLARRLRSSEASLAGKTHVAPESEVHDGLNYLSRVVRIERLNLGTAEEVLERDKYLIGRLGVGRVNLEKRRVNILDH